MFISSAFAQDVAAMGEPSALGSFLPIVVLLGVMYFLLIRPQQKKYKQHVSMIQSIGKGDKIVTSGGIIGEVVKVDAEKDQLTVKIADGVQVDVVRSTVSSVLESKSAPKNDNDAKAKKAA